MQAVHPVTLTREATGRPLSIVATLLLAVFGLIGPDRVRAESIDELLARPAAFHRKEVSVTGRVTSIVIDRGEKPSTKFKLRDRGRTIPVYMRGAHALSRDTLYRVDGVFLVKPSNDGSARISGIVGRVAAPQAVEVAAGEPTETRSLEAAGPDVSAWMEADVAGEYGLSVSDLLEDPAAFDRTDVGLWGTVSSLAVASGDTPSTKFKLDDGSGALPVFMRGAHALVEGGMYEVDGVFLVKQTDNGTARQNGLVARTVEPLDIGSEDPSVPPATGPAPAPQPSTAPPSKPVPEYELAELLADQARFDRQVVSVTGRATSHTTRYGARTYQKFKLGDGSGEIPVFVPETSPCRQGQLCKVTGVFLIKPASAGAPRVSGIKANVVERLADAAPRTWRGAVSRSGPQRSGVQQGVDAAANLFEAL